MRMWPYRHLYYIYSCSRMLQNSDKTWKIQRREAIGCFFCQCGGSELILVRIQVQHFAFTDMDPTFRIKKVKQIRNGVFSKRDEEFVHFPPYYESLQST